MILEVSKTMRVMVLISTYWKHHEYKIPFNAVWHEF